MHGCELESTELDVCRECERLINDGGGEHAFAGDLVTIVTYSNEQEASIAQATLAEEGIAAFLSGDESATNLWYIGTALGGVRLQVASGDAERAYDLLQSASDEEPSLPTQPWICAGCGETVDTGFAVCWSCGGIVAQAGEEGHGEPPEDSRTQEPEPEFDLDLDTPLEEKDDDSPDAEPECEGDEVATRAWRAAIFGIGFFPLVFYAVVLIFDASQKEMSPRGTRRFFGAVAIVALMFVIAWLVTRSIYRP